MKGKVYKTALAMLLVAGLSAPVVRVAALRYDAQPWRVIVGGDERSFQRDEFALRSDEGPDTGPFEPVLLEACTKSGSWDRRAAWGGLSPTRELLACWLELYPDATFALLMYRDLLPHGDEGSRRMVEHEWEYEELANSAWLTQISTQRRQQLWSRSDFGD